MSSLHKANKHTNLTIEHQVDPLLSLHHDLNKTMSHFYDLFEPMRFNVDHFENLKLAPCMDLVETKDCYKIEVEMPGLDEKDIHISMDGNVLNVIGEKCVSKKDNGIHFIDREIKYGRYERSITLPQLADWDRITANFKKGMLWITIPKKAGKKTCAREIKITHVK